MSENPTASSRDSAAVGPPVHNRAKRGIDVNARAVTEENGTEDSAHVHLLVSHHRRARNGAATAANAN
jgi:hypothetical protein